MAKVSIGLRGWRFDEDVVFDADGSLRPLSELPDDTRERLLRLQALLGEPCDACWLIHGEENKRQCNVADVVYGEPMGEVLLCADHEPDFLYWFHEEGGREYAGDASMRAFFHEWFDQGGRAPDEYAGIEHVDEDPDSLPDVTANEGIFDVETELASLDEEEREAIDVDLSDFDV
jgi:hypothetical protein